jgi:hypothetical protein
LDATLPPRRGRSHFGSFLTRHAALGLVPVAAPVAVFLPLGILLGPHVLGVVNDRVLSLLDPVASFALAALGVFAGLAVDDIVRRPRLLAASALEAGATLGLVAASGAFLMIRWQMPLELPVGLAALCLGLGAAPSSAPALGAEHPGARVADLDDVVPIAAGGVLLAVVAHGWSAAPALLLLTVVIGIAAGAVAVLLLKGDHSPSERITFVVGTLLLIGGGAAYVGLSPLMAGFAAGGYWRYRGRGAGEEILLDLQRLHHPLVVLLLVVAGASSILSVMALWLTAAVITARLAGKLVGGWLATRVAGAVAPVDLGMLLLPPGVFGIAVLLNLRQVFGPGVLGPVLTATVLSAVAFEVLGLLAGWQEESR